jgi:hypothetical protein
LDNLLFAAFAAQTQGFPAPDRALGCTAGEIAFANRRATIFIFKTFFFHDTSFGDAKPFKV